MLVWYCCCSIRASLLVHCTSYFCTYARMYDYWNVLTFTYFPVSFVTEFMLYDSPPPPQKPRRLGRRVNCLFCKPSTPPFELVKLNILDLLCYHSLCNRRTVESLRVLSEGRKYMPVWLSEYWYVLRSIFIFDSLNHLSFEKFNLSV